MVQYVLLFRSYIWVVMTRILRAVGSLHNWATLRISGRMPQQLRNRVWDYPPIWEALVGAVMEIIVVYVTHHQNTMSKYISMRTIFEITVL